jgi:diguanylate cyclase (GGDEF)-like protein/PAS domain S-box-containing protein
MHGMEVRFPGQRPTVGVLLPHVGGYYYASVLSGIQRVARGRGARVVAFQTKGLDLLWPAEPHTLPLGWECIDGWIGINDLSGTSLYDRLIRSGRPFVTVSTTLQVAGVCSVLPDNRGGIEQAVRHLFEHGHRRIGFAGGLNQTDLRERFEAYRATLVDLGLSPDPSLFFPTNSTHEDDGHAVGRQLVARGLPCTALVVSTDSNAVGIAKALVQAGCRVPADVAIIGFDDVDYAQYAEPPLASVRVPFDAISAAAAEVLFARILDGAEGPSLVRVPSLLVPRDSCGCGSSRGIAGGRTGEARATPIDERSARRVDLGRKLLEVATRGAPPAGEPHPTTGRAAIAMIEPAALALAAHLEASLRGEPPPPEASVRAAWLQLLGAAHDVETVDRLLATIEEAAASPAAVVVGRSAPPARPDGAGARGPGPSAAERARSVVRSFRQELMRAWRSVEQRRARYRESNAQANRKIDLALIGADLASTQDLSWLRWARVRHAVLGEWRPATARSARALMVKNVFPGGPAGTKLDLPGEYEPGRFPGPELIALLDDPGTEDILSVVPISGHDENRGILAVVGPIELEIDDDTGNLAQWAALLSAAIDRDELLGSLRHAAETLRRSEERYALAAHGANDGLWDWDGASGRLYLSPRWKSILGYGDDELVSDRSVWLARVHPDDRKGLLRAMKVALSERQSHVEHEYRMTHKDGRWIWVLSRGVVVFDDAGRAMRFAGSQTDVTARKEAEENLRRSALHDALTGLPNRALLLERLDRSIAGAYDGAHDGAHHDPEARFGVLFLDLDHFKTLNDSLGHLVGDQLLIQIAQRLCACLRAADTVARLGGDEFAIIVARLDSDQAAALIAERVQDALRAPFQIGEHRVFTSASVGIALSSEKYRRAEDFLRDADTAMYRAKSQGRARHQLFDGQMHEQAMERLRIEAGLRRALERGEFVLHYQPVVSLETGAVVGVEALIRWEHPERGLLPPSVFLGIADESGLIAPMSDWVIGAACEQARRWQSELPEPTLVSVNIPPQQLEDARLAEVIEGHLRRAGVPASALGLELVESSLIENRGVTLSNLKRLRAMGVRIAVDDFGTGYSSLSYLKRLPLDALKIDRSFTQGIPGDPNDTAISKTIVAMARSLNLDVVAEGVETVEQMEFLRANGCRLAQGHYFSRPLPAEACAAYIRETYRASRPLRPLRLLGTGTER